MKKITPEKTDESDELFLKNITFTLCNGKYAKKAILVRSTLAALAGIEKEMVRSDMKVREYRRLYLKANGTVQNWKKHFIEEFERQAIEVLRYETGESLPSLFPLSLADRFVHARFPTVGCWVFAVTVYWIRKYYALTGLDETVFVSDLYPITDSEWQKLPRFKHIKEICIGNLEDYDDTFVFKYSSLFALLPELEKIEFYGVEFHKGMLKNLAGHPRLKNITIGGYVELTDDVFATLGTIPHLEKLILESPSITPSKLQTLRSLQHLRELAFDYPHSLCECLECLSEFPALEELTLTEIEDDAQNGIPINETDLVPLAKCSRLKSLSVITSDALDNKGLERLAEVTSLESLGLISNGITDEGLACLTRLPNLKSLDLSGNPGVTEAGFESIRLLKNLEELILPTGIATDAVLSALDVFPKMKRLTLGRATDSGLQTVGRLPQLESLTIYYNAEVTTTGLQALLSLPRLQKLKICHSQNLMTERELEVISRLENLTHLSIWTQKPLGKKTAKQLERLKNLTQLTVAEPRVFRSIKEVFELHKIIPALDDLNDNENLFYTIGKSPCSFFLLYLIGILFVLLVVLEYVYL